ncbi:condensation domain-containing protein, partial [Streptomyces brasiliscabiei]|uniref:condensation domain-containing protein n=1 Tax=Streptomyces brasiliscabiei TaxID=2736302 RepID=UPI001C11471D
VRYTAPADPLDTAPRWYEIRREPHTPQQLTELELALCNRPFDLTTEAPVRAVLVPDHSDCNADGDGDRAHLLLVVHHAAADGFSLKLLAEDLWSLYTALDRADGVPELPAPQAEFADYAAALTTERQSPAHARNQQYWRDRLTSHTPPHPSLPYD